MALLILSLPSLLYTWAQVLSDQPDTRFQLGADSRHNTTAHRGPDGRRSYWLSPNISVHHHTAALVWKPAVVVFVSPTPSLLRK